MVMIIKIKPEPYCPICGGKMILRRPKIHQTWLPFWGCNQFPNCVGTRNIDEEGNPESDEDTYWRDYEDERYEGHPGHPSEYGDK